jgi:hypothetical protein
LWSFVRRPPPSSAGNRIGPRVGARCREGIPAGRPGAV